jgi:YggT family protein
MSALIYLVQTLFGLYQAALLLRLLMQMTRADFRNPFARAIVQITDPVIRPLRKALPAAGKVDTASLVAILLVTVLKLAVIQLLILGAMPGINWFVRATVIDVLRMVLQTYFFCILLYGLLSFVAQGNYNPIQSVLESVCEPLLSPIRRRIPPLGGLDLTPLWVLIAIQALLLLIR